MNKEDFIRQLNEAQELMKAEKYKEAVILLDKLKQVEQNRNFDFSETRKLYQLISNAHSLYNQQLIINGMNELLLKQKVISFKELNQLLNERTDLNLDVDVFRKEVELLILKGHLKCSIEGDLIVF